MNAAILLFAALIAATPVEPTARWNGLIADQSLQKFAPAEGFLADADSLAKVWKAWRPKEEVPTVDFTKEVILVGVVPGPNSVMMAPSLDEKGDLQFIVVGTQVGGPGFGYLLLKISREGVKTVNGKPLASASTAPVRAQVIFGSEARNEQRTDSELWISREAKQAGSPAAQPFTTWIALTAVEQRIYTSTQGGFIIDGKATEQSGKYEVEINGCEGVAYRQSITLKPGERRVVKLTDNPAPNNVFIAFAAAPPADESISVTVVGTLHTGIVAIGGETTGTTITAKDVTWELDFGKNAELRKAAEKHDGKKVTVRGTLERRAGVEIKERWIVTVTDLQAAGGDGR